MIAVPQLAQAQEAKTAASGQPVPAQAERSRPNVLVIMTDDVGYAASSSFGGLVDTPTFDRIARLGLRYNNFHTSPLCSPTRAALLTGRNPHDVGMGIITEMASGDDGYITAIPRSAATLARVLRDNGYHTSMFGKYHLMPKWELDAVGQKPHWPNAMGFDYFYGFEPAMVDQFTPELFENQNYVQAPTGPAYRLEQDLADKAISWLRGVKSSGAGKPFFLYYAPETAHAPVQAPAEWIARYRGKFDMGWDKAREQVLARQKQLGIVPPSTVLSERDKDVPAWETLTPAQKTKYARLMEVYAAALSYADYQVGRMLDELQAQGQLDNTLVVYIQGDNGPSPEGGPTGAVNYYNRLNAVPEAADTSPEVIAKLGGSETAPAVPIGWTNALATPFRKWKMDGSMLGGVTNALALSWPAGLAARGEIRSQFHAINDIAPTIYQLAGIEAPAEVDGIRQQPITGTSMVYSFASGKEPSRHREQYFETLGTVGMYKDGWFGSTRVEAGQTLTADNPATLSWGLYDLTSDFSQVRDVAAGNPAKLQEIQAAFSRMGSENKVFPVTRSHRSAAQSPQMAKTGNHVIYPGLEHYLNPGFPITKSRSWSMTTAVEVPKEGGSGVVVSVGGRFAGWGVVFLAGVPHLIYKYDNTPEGTLVLKPEKPLPAGRHSLKVEVEQKGRPIAVGAPYKYPGSNQGATFTFSIDHVAVASGELKTTPSNNYQFQGAAVGHSNGDSLLPLYSGRFEFNGRIDPLNFELGPPLEPVR